MFQYMVIAFHGKVLADPIRPAYYPAESLLEWHVKEVFQGPGRYFDTRAYVLADSSI